MTLCPPPRLLKVYPSILSLIIALGGCSSSPQNIRSTKATILSQQWLQNRQDHYQNFCKQQQRGYDCEVLPEDTDKGQLKSKRVDFDRMPTPTELSFARDLSSVSISQDLSSHQLRSLAQYDSLNVMLTEQGALSDDEVSALILFKKLSIQGRLKLSEAHAQRIARCDCDLDIHDESGLSQSAIIALAQAKANRLTLQRIQQLSPKSAQALADFKGAHLNLYLDHLDPTSAKLLISQSRENLTIRGLKSLTKELAMVLRSYQGIFLTVSAERVERGAMKALKYPASRVMQVLIRDHNSIRQQIEDLSSDGLQNLIGKLKTLNTEEAKLITRAINQREFNAHLVQLTTLSAPVAQLLAQARTNHLQLPKIKKLESGVAKALASFGRGVRSYLHLDSIKTISPTDAQALSSYRGTLILSGVTTLSADSARALKAFQGTLWLGDVSSLSQEAAQALASSNMKALLIGAQRLRPEVLKALYEFPRKITFKKLRSIDPENARRFLTRTRSKSAFFNLAQFNPDSVILMSSMNQAYTRFLKLPQVSELDAPSARALSTFVGRRLIFPNIKSITPQAIDELAKLGDDWNLTFGERVLQNRLILSVDQLLKIRHLIKHSPSLYHSYAAIQSLSADQASALVDYHKVGVLPLYNLKEMSVEVARALARYQGKSLRLDGMSSLSIEQAQELSAFKGSELSLAGLSELSPELLKALLEFKGSLLLDGLNSPLSDEIRSLLKSKPISLRGLSEPI